MTRELPHFLRCISFAEDGVGVTSGFREKDVSRNEVVASSVLSCVIAVGPSFVHQYKLLTVAKNGPGSALSEC